MDLSKVTMSEIDRYLTKNDILEHSGFLAHHGILGQKWGIRRFQNKDGSLTPEGKKRYSEENEVLNKNNAIKSSEIKISEKTKASFEKMRNSAPTDEEKDKRVSAWERARDTDMYEMYFLESIQNSDIFDKEDLDAMLGEYAKYLSDRYNYMENEAYKLKGAY